MRFFYFCLEYHDWPIQRNARCRITKWRRHFKLKDARTYSVFNLLLICYEVNSQVNPPQRRSASRPAALSSSISRQRSVSDEEYLRDRCAP